MVLALFPFKTVFRKFVPLLTLDAPVLRFVLPAATSLPELVTAWLVAPASVFWLFLTL